MAGGAGAAAWVAEHKIGRHVELAIAKLIQMNPRPSNPIEVLGKLLIEGAAPGGSTIGKVPTATGEPAVESHQKSEVDENVAAASMRSRGAQQHGRRQVQMHTAFGDPVGIAERLQTRPFYSPREGTHNVAQREWRERPEWDGKSECALLSCLRKLSASSRVWLAVLAHSPSAIPPPLPSHPASCRPYTIDNDPEYAFADAELNEKGRGQATALQQQTASLAPELLVVSPMRRATLTGLMAFEEHVTKERCQSSRTSSATNVRGATPATSGCQRPSSPSSTLR